jgi:polysaccharide biosynthesis transport protein
MQSTAKTSEGFDVYRYWLIVQRRWPPALLTALSLFGLLFWNLQNKSEVYQAKGQLRFNLPDTTSSLIGLNSGSDSSDSGYKDPLATEIKEMSSRDFLDKVVKNFKTTSSTPKIQMNLDDLTDGLSIDPVEETDVVTVSFEDDNPRLAAQVVNQVMKVYVQNNLLSKRTKTSTARDFILSQLPQVRRRVFGADTALRNFKETYRVSDLDTTKAGIAASQIKVQDQLDAVDTELAKLDAQSASVRSQFGVNSQQALAVNTVAQSEAVQEILKSIELNKKKLAEDQGSLGPDHPEITDLQERQRKLQEHLNKTINQKLNGQKSPNQNSTELNATRQALLDTLVQNELAKTGFLKQRQVLFAQRLGYANQSKLMPDLEQRQRELQRELTAAESTYEALLKSFQDLRVTENQIIPTVKIIETASVPLDAILPNRKTELLRNIAVSLLGAAAMIYLLEITDRKVKTVDSICEAYPYPLLGNIPKFTVTEREGSQLPTIIEPHSFVSESYRMLQTNLRFLSSENPLRIITITSAQPEEGKSITASNLSAVLAQIGHRVLLIDANLRKPYLHNIWNIPNLFGLSNVLGSSEDTKVKKTLPTHAVSENLHVLTAGVIPQNPLALLDSQQMPDLLQGQLDLYDYILIDSPPLNISADPLAISRYSDGILLVARPEILEKGSIKIAQNIIFQSGVNVLGIVANSVISKNENYGYHQPHRIYNSQFRSVKNNDEKLSLTQNVESNLEMEKNILNNSRR